MYRTARAHPPSCCQVSFPLTLHLAPDLTSTRFACLFACLLCSLCTPAHTYTCTHIIHGLESFPTVGQKDWVSGFSCTSQSCWILPKATYDTIWCMMLSVTHSDCPGVFALLVHTSTQVVATSSLEQRAHSLWGLWWGISLPITVVRAAFEYFMSKSELWDDA